jgi:hypothetical protein
MTGRNSKPKNNGPAGHPGRLDQFGAKLSTENDEEFFAASMAADQACDTTENSDMAEPHH